MGEEPVRNHRQLKVWQRAIALAVGIMRFCNELRNAHYFVLADQLMGSAISVPSNIAEGSARGSALDYRRFIRISLGPLAEMDTQVEVAHRSELLDLARYSRWGQEIIEIRKMLGGLWRSLGPES